MKEFIRPEMEKIVIEGKDVIVTSGGNCPPVITCTWDCTGVGCNNNNNGL